MNKTVRKTSFAPIGSFRMLPFQDDVAVLLRALKAIMGVVNDFVRKYNTSARFDSIWHHLCV